MTPAAQSTLRPRFATSGHFTAAGLLLAVIVFAGTATANSSAFAFTMELRYVNGQKNKQIHTLDAGELTVSGNVWVTSKNTRATSTPQPVTIRVASTGLFGSTACTVTVTPDATFNNKRAFSKSCGRIESGSYWIEVSKDQAIDKTGDGRHLQGSGNLGTK